MVQWIFDVGYRERRETESWSGGRCHSNRVSYNEKGIGT